MTELTEAAAADDAMQVKALIEAGASVNLADADADGVPPVAHAKACGFAGMIHLLPRAGAE